MKVINSILIVLVLILISFNQGYSQLKVPPTLTKMLPKDRDKAPASVIVWYDGTDYWFLRPQDFTGGGGSGAGYDSSGLSKWVLQVVANGLLNKITDSLHSIGVELAKKPNSNITNYATNTNMDSLKIKMDSLYAQLGRLLFKTNNDTSNAALLAQILIGVDSANTYLLSQILAARHDTSGTYLLTQIYNVSSLIRAGLDSLWSISKSDSIRTAPIDSVNHTNDSLVTHYTNWVQYGFSADSSFEIDFNKDFTNPQTYTAGTSYTTKPLPITGHNKIYMRKKSTYSGYLHGNLVSEGK